MVFVDQYASNGDEAIVHTGDMNDMEMLRDALFKDVKLRALS